MASRKTRSAKAARKTKSGPDKKAADTKPNRSPRGRPVKFAQGRYRRQKAIIQQVKELHRRMGLEKLRDGSLLSEDELAVVEARVEVAAQALVGLSRQDRALVWLEGALFQAAVDLWENNGATVAYPEIFVPQLHYSWQCFLDVFPEYEGKPVPLKEMARFELAFAGALTGGRPKGTRGKPRGKWEALRDLAATIGLVSKRVDPNSLRRRVIKARKRMFPDDPGKGVS